MSRRPTVAIVGDAHVPSSDPRLAFAEDAGRRIVDAGWILQTGGRGGVMEAASRGARSAGRWSAGCIVAILPGTDPRAANEHADVVLATGLGQARNVLVASADAVLAIGGRAGTLSEMALAWTLRRLIVARRGDGWSGRLADHPIDDRIRIPEVPNDQVWGADTPQEAVALLQRWLPVYQGFDAPTG